MHAFRAIETGAAGRFGPPRPGFPARSIRGAACSGVADYFAEGDRTLTVQMPLGGVPTLYARIGDLFAWLCVAGVVLARGRNGFLSSRSKLIKLN